MKKLTLTSCQFLALISGIIFVIFWAVWFICYRYYLVWLEGYSFFSTLPDFASQYLSSKEGFPGYIGAFLHQFYDKPLIGAAIQSFLMVWPTICIGIILQRFFNQPVRLMWIAFLPMLFIARRQFWDLHMNLTIQCSMVATAAMLLVLLITAFWRPRIELPKILKNYWLNAAVMLLMTVNSFFVLFYLEPRNRVYEEYARLEYLGERGRWDDILKSVKPRDAHEDELKKAYALLALSEKGILPDYAFRYGLNSSEDFIFSGKIEPICLNYNALFFQCQKMHNAVIHQAYQQGVQSVTGVSFSTLRRLADTYIALKDYDLARKYVDILSHSTCHGKWVKSRLPLLEEIRNAEPEYIYDEFKAAISNFSHTMSSMVDRHRDDRRYADLLLCSLLADGEGEQFKQIFQYVAETQYRPGTPIPRLYEEALILIAMVDPYVLDDFNISEDTRNRFTDYVNMMNSGKGSQALRKHADTYWAYSY